MSRPVNMPKAWLGRIIINNNETNPDVHVVFLNQLSTELNPFNTRIRITLYTLAHAKKDHSAGETWHILLEVVEMNSMECWTYTRGISGNIWHWHGLPGWRFDTLLKREYVDAALLGILWLMSLIRWWHECRTSCVVGMILDHCWLNWWSRLVQLKVVHALILGRCHLARDCHGAKRGARMIKLCADALKKPCKNAAGNSICLYMAVLILGCTGLASSFLKVLCSLSPISTFYQRMAWRLRRRRLGRLRPCHISY